MVVESPAIVVPIDLIEPNPWNPNVQPDWVFEKELASIRKYGFVDPLTVRELNAVLTGGPKAVVGYQIIDGEHRWRAAKQLGYTELPCWNLGSLDDDDARELTIVLNETRGQPDEGRLRTLLQDLISRRGEGPLRDIMPFSRSRFDELLQRRQIDWGGLEERRQALQEEGRWKELVYRLPRDAAKVVEDAVASVQEREGFDNAWQALEMICADKLAEIGTT